VTNAEPRRFRLNADYRPAGDQPQAIAKLTDGLENGLVHQTLLGVTGSGLKDASINAHIEQMRLSATKALLERHDTIMVATVSSIYGLASAGVPRDGAASRPR
jgi:excinuclease UvrABC helicase subunit UvrB